MMIANYPVGWSIRASGPGSIVAYLIDLPTVAMQGETALEAFQKLLAYAPIAIEGYRAEGRPVPPPSPEPTMSVGALEWSGAIFVEAVGAVAATTRRARSAKIELVPAPT